MKRTLIVIGAFIFVISTALYMQYRIQNPPVPYGPIPPTLQGTVIASSKPIKHARLHSGKPIIQGGVHSLSQLEMAVNNPEIAESFAGIDLSLMHPVVLNHNQIAWVDYLVPGIGIYWVMNPVLLKKGEVVWTDGTNVIRGLCGNRVAWSPGLKVAPELEEIPSELETPISPIYTINQVYPPATLLTPTTPYSPSAPPIYTPFPPRSPGVPTSGADNPLPTVMISIICICLLGLLRNFLKKRLDKRN